MASEKQTEANRRNAQLSTGPVTPEGKAAVAQNAFKHGLRAGRILFDPNEDLMQELRADLAAEWQPQTYLEWTLLEQMAVALHKLTCFEELEAEWESRINEHRFAPNLQIIWRRQASLERSFNKALDNLLKLRKARAQAKPVESQPKPKPAASPEPKSVPEPSQPIPHNLVMLEHSPAPPPEKEPLLPHTQ